jgi:hypothetical protein
MDVVLRTHDDAKYLALRNVKRYGDESGYCVDLEVRSGGFAARVLFCFETVPLARFVTALERMDRDLAGAATLQPLHEDTIVITLALDHAGRVSVSGEIVFHAEHLHRLTFGFETDQTCLGPLVRDLKACMVAPAV